MEIITRKEAQAAGKKRYFTGVPCKHGHVCERYSGNGSCIGCSNLSKPTKEEIAAYDREYVARTQEYQRERHQRYYRDNVEEILEKKKIYNAANSKIQTKKKNAYAKERKARDPNFKLSINLRGRLAHAIRDGQKAGSAVHDLGCSIPELVSWLEGQFQPGMTWDNWGNRKGQWSIDHIMPLSRFDLTDREQLLVACHYTNLQPLWVSENCRKGNRLPNL